MIVVYSWPYGCNKSSINFDKHEIKWEDLVFPHCKS